MVMLNAELMTSESGWLAVPAGVALSVTCAVKLNVPLKLVDPLKTPEELSVMPLGRLPAETVHVNGGVPPVAARVWEYDLPASPCGSDVVVMLGAGLTVTE